jgi:hypothetical protein
MIRLLIPAVITLSSLAADPPPVPEQAIAIKKELLFQDDFEGSTRSPLWHRVVDTFTFDAGTLKGTQTRVKDMPTKDGKGVVKAHAAVHGLELPTHDSVVEAKIYFEGATMIDVEFDDRAYKGAHYGHLCRAQVRLDGVMLIDERDGTMKNEIREMRLDPSKKADLAKAMKGRIITYPVTLKPSTWYLLQVETVGDAMRVCIDGKPVAFLKSSGIAHPTKSKIELGVAGASGRFDDIKVWKAEPAN